MRPVSLEQIASLALSRLETVQASYALAQHCIINDVAGDFVECGVFAGAQCAAMALACMEHGDKSRRVHLFDSFIGIPKAGARDNDIRELTGSSDVLETSGVSACSQEAVEGYMRRWGIDESLLVYHPGWFQDTVPVADIPAIAMLRLDGDLYDSTKICLEHFYLRLSRGGWCVADDFNLDGCRAAIADVVGYPAPMYWQRHV